MTPASRRRGETGGRANAIICRCGESMRHSEWFGQFYCERSPIDVEDVRHTGPIDEIYAAAHRMGPFAVPRTATRPAPPELPGFVWTGEFYERIATLPPRSAPPPRRERSILDEAPWLRFVLLVVAVLLVARCL